MSQSWAIPVSHPWSDQPQKATIQNKMQRHQCNRSSSRLKLKPRSPWPCPSAKSLESQKMVSQSPECYASKSKSNMSVCRIYDMCPVSILWSMSLWEADSVLNQKMIDWLYDSMSLSMILWWSMIEYWIMLSVCLSMTDSETLLVHPESWTNTEPPQISTAKDQEHWHWRLCQQ